MKKIALLCAIVCAGQLYGMNEPKPELNPEIWRNLPGDVKQLIMVAFAQSGDDLDETIKNIQKASVLNKTLNSILNNKYGGVSDLKRFTTLVGILAKQFPDKTREEIAQKFNTPVAKEYIALGKQLFWPARKMGPSVEAIKELIDKGADPNFSEGQNVYSAYTNSVLFSIYLSIINFFSDNNGEKHEVLIAILKLLLDAGAKPDANWLANLQRQVNKHGGEFRIELLNLLKQYAD